ncbi:hypothetical protein AAKU64_003594 [Undibacterium sp. GrIS 1.8]
MRSSSFLYFFYMLKNHEIYLLKNSFILDFLSRFCVKILCKEISLEFLH